MSTGTEMEESLVEGFHELFMNHLGGYLHKYMIQEANQDWIAAIVSTKIEEDEETILNGVIGLVETLGLSRNQYYVMFVFYCFLDLQKVNFLNLQRTSS